MVSLAREFIDVSDFDMVQVLESENYSSGRTVLPEYEARNTGYRTLGYVKPVFHSCCFAYPRSAATVVHAEK